MFAYDVDGDGDNDVITSLAAHTYGLAWYEQIKDGDAVDFKKHVIMGDKAEDTPYGILFTEPHAVALVDMDGDGLPDIDSCTFAALWRRNVGFNQGARSRPRANGTFPSFMTPLVWLILPAAYLLGGVSPGYWLVRLRTGEDVRTQGSGATGATNSARLLGRGGFALVLALDAVKGAIAVLSARLAGMTDGWEFAAAVARSMSSLLFGVNAGDYLSYGSAALAILAAALLASYLPARGAAAVEPAIALRAE